MGDATTIYVRLLNEGTLVYRPTKATKQAEDVYKLLPTDDYSSADEEWEFLPGSLVTCAFRKPGNEDILVAVAAV